jgi:hypothetical protein
MNRATIGAASNIARADYLGGAVRYRMIMTAMFLAVLLAGTASAKQPDGQWQMGRLARLQQGSCGFFPKCLELSIETKEYLYVCKWNRGRTARWHREPYFRIISPVEFTIENGNLYIRGAKGKEYKTHLLEKIPIPDKSAYPPPLTT